MPSIQKTIARMNTACETIQSGQHKVLNSRFNASNPNKSVGNSIRKFLLRLPIFKLIFNNFLAVTDPSYTSKALIKFSKKNTQKLSNTDWVVIHKALTVMKTQKLNTEEAAEVKKAEDEIYTLSKEKLSNELGNRLVKKIGIDKKELVSNFLNQLSSDKLHALLTNFSDSEIDKLAIEIAGSQPANPEPQVEPQAAPVNTPQAQEPQVTPVNTPQAQEPQQTSNPITGFELPVIENSPIRPDLPQKVYCFYNEPSIKPAIEDLANAIPGLEFHLLNSDLDNFTDIDKMKLKPHSFQALILVNFTTRVDGDRYRNLADKLQSLCGKNIVYAPLQTQTSQALPDDYKNIPQAKETVTGIVKYNVDHTGMGRDIPPTLVNKKALIDQLISAFNK